jgi:hypothetical protein
MANIGPAAQAVKLELMHARQGMEYYTKLVENLEGVLETLTTFDSTSSSVRSKARTTKAAKLSGRTTSKAKAQTTKSTRQSKLPATGKDFWPTLLTDTPQPASEIFKAAVNALGIKPSAEDRKKLAQRMSNALSVMSKSGEINAEGKHRERLYSKKAVVH